MDPVKLTSQPDVGGDVLDGAQVDKVENMDFHVRQTLVSISVEMSRHFVFFPRRTLLGRSDLGTCVLDCSLSDLHDRQVMQ